MMAGPKRANATRAGLIPPLSTMSGKPTNNAAPAMTFHHDSMNPEGARFVSSGRSVGSVRSHQDVMRERYPR